MDNNGIEKTCVNCAGSDFEHCVNCVRVGGGLDSFSTSTEAYEARIEALSSENKKLRECLIAAAMVGEHDEIIFIEIQSAHEKDTLEALVSWVKDRLAATEDRLDELNNIKELI